MPKMSLFLRMVQSETSLMLFIWTVIPNVVDDFESSFESVFMTPWIPAYTVDRNPGRCEAIDHSVVDNRFFSHSLIPSQISVGKYEHILQCEAVVDSAHMRTLQYDERAF